MPSETPFHDLVENAYDLIQSVGPDGRFLYVNRAWFQTLKYTPEDLPSLRIFDIIHPDSQAHCRLVMDRLMVGEPAADIAATFVAKDGTPVAVEGNASCRFDHGHLIATCAIFRDVSRRKRIEEELGRLFDLSLDMLCVASMDGRFREVNPAFETILGYTQQELLSRAFVEFVHPDDRQKTLQEIENLARGIPTVDFQNRYRAADGSYRWLAWRAAPLLGRGLVYAVARDITDLRRNEELMARQAADLARSNADLEQFAYVASHDLRAPLRNIADLAGWIEEDMPGDAPEAIRGKLHQLRARVRRMETLTEDLLAYSRIGRETAPPVSVDTAALVRDVFFLLAPPRGFAVETAPGLPVLGTQRAPIEQVFRNLLGNAIKHHDRSEGRIVVSARRLGALWEFSVADDGPGIPEASREDVFLMFHKLKSRDEVEGSGMGLAMVKRIVESHGGGIMLESGPGRGTTFRFTWPDQAAIREAHADDPGRR